MQRFSALFYLVWMLFLISLLSFVAIHLAPNSFLSGGELNPNLTQEAIEKLKAIYGLDKPLMVQYRDWIINLAHLNFGISFVNGREISELIYERLPITLIINTITLVLIFVVSMWLGVRSALHPHSILDRVLQIISMISFSMPSFYLALMMILGLSVHLGWLPLGGVHSSGKYWMDSYWLDYAWHLVLPIFVMVFVGFGSLVIYVRSLVIEITKSDYFFFAQSRGLNNKTLFGYIILPNLMPPIVTMLGLSLPGLISGSVILESIFSINGMGLLFYESALSRDYPVIMGILMITALLTLLGNIAADMLLRAINPFAKKGS